MSSYNKVFLVGNLTRDPELRSLSSGASVCKLTLAVDREFTTAQGESREEVCFVDVEVWGRQAESCEAFLRKGAPALVEGRLQQDRWEDRETGIMRSRLLVHAERVQFLPSSRRSGAGSPPARIENGAELRPKSVGFPASVRHDEPLPPPHFEPIEDDADNIPF